MFSFLHLFCNFTRSFNSPPFATVSVEHISGSQPAEVQNLGKFYVLTSNLLLNVKFSLLNFFPDMHLLVSCYKISVTI